MSLRFSFGFLYIFSSIDTKRDKQRQASRQCDDEASPRMIATTEKNIFFSKAEHWVRVHSEAKNSQRSPSNDYYVFIRY